MAKFFEKMKKENEYERIEAARKELEVRLNTLALTISNLIKKTGFDEAELQIVGSLIKRARYSWENIEDEVKAIGREREAEELATSMGFNTGKKLVTSVLKTLDSPEYTFKTEEDEDVQGSNE